MEAPSEPPVHELRAELASLLEIEIGLLERARAREEIAEEREELHVARVRQDALTERLDGAVALSLDGEDAGCLENLRGAGVSPHEMLGQGEALLA